MPFTTNVKFFRVDFTITPTKSRELIPTERFHSQLQLYVFIYPVYTVVGKVVRVVNLPRINFFQGRPGFYFYSVPRNILCFSYHHKGRLPAALDFEVERK